MRLRSGTRADRAVKASAVIAAAYMRFLVGGEETRALQALFTFQQFWNEHRAEMVAVTVPAGGEAPPRLAAHGVFDANVGWAMALVLSAALLGVVEHAPENAEQVPAFFAQHLERVPANDTLWSLYHLAMQGHVANTGATLRAEADAIVDNFTRGADPLTTFVTDDELIIGRQQERTLLSYWPWAVGGIGAVILFAVLTRKMRGRR